MHYKAPGQCPVCGEKLEITKLRCPKCSTVIEGSFEPCEFCRLPKEELEFVKVFIKCRGNIKDVEKELGISYPTVRSKLDTVIDLLGLKTAQKQSKVNIEPKVNKKNEKKEILDALSKNIITAKEASVRLRKLKN